MSTLTALGLPRQPAGQTRVLDQWELFRQTGFNPHRGQVPILASEARFNVSVCGRRFGKSQIGGNKLVPEAMLTHTMSDMLKDISKRREFWIVGPEYSDAEKEFRVLWDRLNKLEVPFDKPGSYNNPIQGEMHISLWDGTFQVHAKSAKHPETLVGEALSGVVMAEAAKIKERVWLRYVRSTLNDFHGWADFTTTPEGKNWIYELWQRGQDPAQEAWRSFRRPAWANPYVYRSPTTKAGLKAVRQLIDDNLPVNDRVALELGVDPEIAQLMVDLTESSFNQEIAAEFTDFVGRVFQDFDEEVHVTDLKYNPEWSTFGAVDYGYTNPNVWLLIQVDPFGEYINVLGEVYQEGLDPDEFAAEILRRQLAPSSMSAFYPDPASPGDTNVLSRKLRVAARAGTGGELRYRLDAIRKALKPFPPGVPDSRPRIQFDRSCKFTIRDFNDYRYADTKNEQDKNAPENPMKVKDHAPEALGRFFAGHFGTAQTGHGRSRQSRAAVVRR